MSRNIHLYHLRGKEQSMISMGLIGFKEGDTLLSLRQKLEDIRIFESAFQFWDSRLGSLVHKKLEALIFVEDLEVETAWREHVERLIIWQQKENKVDHEWRVKTWDGGECVVGMFECLEYQCCLGRSDRGKDKAIVQNLFINYLNKHIGSCAIVEKVNGKELSQKKPFIVEGDVKREPCYSWILRFDVFFVEASSS
ncbi:hypothetical protein R1flu_003966 [Riccia fluitans]|uniref:Uncharacterized protein n=1 Tax=Riccia fluitans TaxID=41844 RepID=A0ABD1YRZ1_9MARC